MTRHVAATLVLLALAAPAAGEDLVPLTAREHARLDAQGQGQGQGSSPQMPVQGAPAPAPSRRGEISTTGSYHSLSDSLGSWTFLQFRGVLHAGPSDVWTGEAVERREFGDAGVFVGVANTHTFNQDWFIFTAAGTSAGGFFLPRFRADVSVSRKWLQARRLVTTVGGGYHVAKDAHRDYSLAAGGAYFFSAPVIVEGGVTWNNSMPGGVVSRYQFLAFTHGRERERYIIVRVAGGHEAYQLIAPASPIADFASRSASLTVRQWVNTDWGLSAAVEVYSNSSYARRAVTAGVFKQF